MLQISRATPKDIPALVQMIGRLCAFHGDTSVMGLADAQARFCGGPLTALIATRGTAYLGYAVLEPHWRPMNDGDLLDIAHLYVEERFRGQGIGSKLIAAARDHARAVGACRLVIGTSLDNPRAAETYRKMGFDEITVTGARFRIALD